MIPDEREAPDGEKPQGPRVERTQSPSKVKRSLTKNDNGSKSVENNVLQTEPAVDGGFDELVSLREKQKLGLRRRGSFQLERRSSILTPRGGTPNMIFALMGDKDSSDHELSDGVDDSEDETDTKGETSTQENLTSDDNKPKVQVHDVDEQQTSFFEQIDEFEIRDADIKDINVIPKNRLISSALDGLVSINNAR